ncbi:hypothetical protein X772_28200 [Mesorhizobium sp. LSJC280B00]|nr:hypothetical protein X772_28200 [Mesorhizobium sp. LSJC280B00]
MHPEWQRGHRTTIPHSRIPSVSTNLGPWVNRRGLFARRSLADTFRSERIASAQKWEFGTSGQHIELGIAENNLFILLSALGLSHSIFGKRLLPIGTLYDPFIQRACAFPFSVALNRTLRKTRKIAQRSGVEVS